MGGGPWVILTPPPIHVESEIHRLGQLFHVALLGRKQTTTCRKRDANIMLHVGFRLGYSFQAGTETRHFTPTVCMTRTAAVILFVMFTPTLLAQWTPRPSGTKAGLRGLSVVDQDTVWVGGTQGTILRTTDGGSTWKTLTIPGAEKLDFRSLVAFSSTQAYALSAGSGAESRLFVTQDAGAKWTCLFTANHNYEFYDALAFWNATEGLAFSDPVEGKFRFRASFTSGKPWQPLPPAGMPAALPKEGAFAASGTGLLTLGDKSALFVTGGAKTSRVFRTKDKGETWTAAELPLPAGVESAGAFSIAAKDTTTLMVVGGDYKKDTVKGPHAAISRDGGATWTATTSTPFLSCVAWAGDRWVAVGTAGTWETADHGTTWKEVNRLKLNAVAFAKTGEGFAVGPEGAIYTLAR
jgi:photosystem II stability/assembly factor-like uncharacterized protein